MDSFSVLLQGGNHVRSVEATILVLISYFSRTGSGMMTLAIPGNGIKPQPCAGVFNTLGVFTTLSGHCFNLPWVHWDTTQW